MPRRCRRAGCRRGRCGGGTPSPAGSRRGPRRPRARSCLCRARRSCAPSACTARWPRASGSRECRRGSPPTAPPTAPRPRPPSRHCPPRLRRPCRWRRYPSAARPARQTPRPARRRKSNWRQSRRRQRLQRRRQRRPPLAPPLTPVIHQPLPQHAPQPPRLAHRLALPPPPWPRARPLLGQWAHEAGLRRVHGRPQLGPQGWVVAALCAHLFRGLHALQVRLHTLRPSGPRLLLRSLLLQRSSGALCDHSLGCDLSSSCARLRLGFFTRQLSLPRLQIGQGRRLRFVRGRHMPRFTTCSESSSRAHGHPIRHGHANSLGAHGRRA
eukprot:scaffold22372_cov69-Phaeocystis_antarctica.AAC.1